jgi:hypothetical protein
MIESKHYELTAMTDRVLDDTAHDLRIIRNTVEELRMCAPEDRDETIEVALGLIDELISTLES